MERQQKDIGLSVDDESAVSKIKLCLRLRVAALTDVVLRKDSLSLEHIKTLGDVFDGMFVRNVAGRFPIDLTKFHAEIARLNGGASGGGSVAGTHGDHDADDESSTFSGSAAARGVAASSDAGAVSAELASGTLLPPPTVLASNFKCIVFEIDAVGLKDAETYLDARITVSVCGAACVMWLVFCYYLFVFTRLSESFSSDVVFYSAFCLSIAWFSSWALSRMRSSPPRLGRQPARGVTRHAHYESETTATCRLWQYRVHSDAIREVARRLCHLLRV